MSTMPAIDRSSVRPVATGGWQLPDSASLGAAAAKLATRKAWRQSLPLVVPIVFRVIPGPAKIVSYVWATAYAFLGRRQAIMALALIWFCNLFTHAAGVPPPAAAFFRHGAVFAAAISVFIVHAGALPRSRTPGLLVWTAVMSVLLLAHSMVFSTVTDISVLKAISFGVSIQTLLTAWSRLSAADRAVTENQLWGLLYAIGFFSVPLVVLPAGYIRTRTGFQGVMEHPQLYGQLSGIIAVWLSATWLTQRKMAISLKILLPICLAGIYLSRSRMALVLFLTGVGVAVATGAMAPVFSRLKHAPRLLKRRLALAAVAALLSAGVAGPLLFEAYQVFLRKGRAATTISEAAWESRGFMIEIMNQNIREHPLTGIGLGVPSKPELTAGIIRDPYFGLPVMAVVEKGVLPVAMVEEMGWPLALLYAPWFLALLVSAVRAGPRYAGVCAAGLTLNMSEAVFFSPGGGGMMVLLLVSMAATAQPPTQVLPAMNTPPRAA